MKHFIIMLTAAMFVYSASAKEVDISSPVVNATTVNSEVVMPVMMDNYIVATDSEWVEVQSVVIPFSVELHEGVTKSNNPKYWFEFEGIGKVSVSASNAIKFKEQNTVLMLVKWFNSDTNKYRYSTRQQGGTAVRKSGRDVDLNKLFN